MNHRCPFYLLLMFGAGITVPVLVHHSGEVRLREMQAKLVAQSDHLGHLRSTAQSTIRSSSATNTSSQLAPDEISELARLRNEARQLKEALRQGDRLRKEKRRIEQALEQRAQQVEEENPTALLAEEMPVRRARVAALQEWLEQNPKERIPELRFLSEDSWIRSAERERVTDEDFERWVGAQRGNAEAKVARVLHQALKAFAQKNNGGFPTDLAQLRPFFSTPIEDVILDRYHIVSTQSLPKLLAEVGGEWAITQKVPVNPKYDSRLAISLKDRRGTLAEGRWDGAGED